MATRYVNVDRRTPMLLPVDMREWVPEDDMVHFVIASVVDADGSQLVLGVPQLQLQATVQSNCKQCSHKDGIKLLQGELLSDPDLFGLSKGECLVPASRDPIILSPKSIDGPRNLVFSNRPKGKSDRLLARLSHYRSRSAGDILQ